MPALRSLFKNVIFMNVPLLIISVCILYFLRCATSSEEEKHNDGIKIRQSGMLVEDGAWCWFSDPRAVYHKGEKEQMYFGYINSRGDVCIGSNNLETGQTESFVLHDTLEIDDHNVPSLLVLPDGKLLAFYNEHNGNLFLRESIHREDINAWHEEQIIAQETEEYNYTYTNPLRLSEENGRIYLIGRKVGPTRSYEHWRSYMKYSDDEGKTWSTDIILFDNEGRKNPPYLKVTTDHKSRIDFLFTDGHPKIGSDVSVYHMYYAMGRFYQTRGESIANLDQLPVPINSVNKVYDATQSNVRSWIWDIALKDGNPVITYARYPSVDDHIYHYAYWQEGRWVDLEIVNSGSWMVSLQQDDKVREAHYSGGIVLDHQNPDHIYVSRDIYGKFEIEHRWLLPDDQWSISLITESSSLNNVRPYVVDQSPKDQALLLWMHGVYRHYTEYDMGIKIARINY